MLFQAANSKSTSSPKIVVIVKRKKKSVVINKLYRHWFTYQTTFTKRPLGPVRYKKGTSHTSHSYLY